MTVELICGDALEILKTMPDQSVNCCVTSPPYYGLRDYGVDGQIGLEATPEEYVDNLVNVFREVKRVLRDNGTAWVNLGDSYAGSGGAGGDYSDGGLKDGQPKFNGTAKQMRASFRRDKAEVLPGRTKSVATLKPKDLIGIPWRVAFALQADGWWLRSDIIWSKPNPMPESVTDRPTKSHEYIFLLSKSAQYFYDAEAVKEPCKWSNVERLSQNIESQPGSGRVPGKTNGNMKAVAKNWNPSMAGGAIGIENRKHSPYPLANKRTVWVISTHSFKEAHFATFPPKLIEPCVLAGCPAGGTVMDPFNGAGTTGVVCIKHGRNYIGIELNPEYVEMSRKRLDDAQQQIRMEI
ncbi:MAG: site-specific DNA-methyltransferase [Methanoregula sp.]|jgi:DNA modification methylase|nr:site-specific DNA-methyltransferase [Methanoregula sp.]